MKPGRQSPGRQRSRRATASAGRAESPPVQPQPAPWDRRDWMLLGAIIAVAFILRVVYDLQLRSSPWFATPQMDELYHDQWARALAAGETFVEGPYFRAPLYPFFLAEVYKVFGHGYLAPRIIQALIGSLSCGLLYLIGRTAFNRTAAAVAGFAAASYWILVYFDGELLIPVLLVFLDLLMIWLLLRAFGRPGKVAYALAGVALGLSAVARPNVLLFAPAVVLWLLVLYRPNWRRAAGYAACFGAGCLMPVLPVTVRNYVVGQDLVLIASQAGVNFYIGNNPDSDGMAANLPGAPGEWWGGYNAAIEMAEDARGRPLKASEVSRYFFGRAWRFIADQPGAFVSLTARKMWLFWIRGEIPNNKSIYFWSETFTPIVRLLPLSFGIVGPLGILGMVLCWRRRAELFPLWGFVLVYMLSVTMFFCTARYRVPVVAPLILLGAYAAHRIVAALRQASPRRVLIAVAVLVPATAFVNVTPLCERLVAEAQSYHTLASSYRMQGDLERAIKYYRMAIDAHPEYLSARHDLGLAFLELDRTAEAVEQFRQALTAVPVLQLSETAQTQAAVRNNLGGALIRLGRPAEAVEYLRQAIDLTPDGHAQAQFNLGVACASLGRRDEAIEAYRETIRLDPEHVEAHHHLATVLAAGGRLGEAIELFEETLRLDPNHVEALRKLAAAQVLTNRLSEADATYERAIPLIERLRGPNDPLLASCLRDRARLLRKLQRGAEAIPLEQRAAAIRDGSAE